MKKQIKDHVKDACHAHTNLNVFASVVSILEGGHLYGATSDRVAQQIISICQREESRCLARYDKAVAVVCNRPVPRHDDAKGGAS